MSLSKGLTLSVYVTAERSKNLHFLGRNGHDDALLLTDMGNQWPAHVGYDPKAM